MISRIKTDDCLFIRLFHHHLSPEVIGHIKWRVESAADVDDEVCPQVTVSGVTLTFDMLHQFHPDASIDRSAMRMMLAVLAKRDSDIMKAYKDVNSDTNNYQQRYASLFSNPACLQELLECGGDILEPSTFFNQHFRNQDARLADAHAGTLYRIYFTSHAIMQETEEQPVWTLFIADFSKRKIYYINPLHDASQLDTVGRAINRFLDKVVNEANRDGQWDCLMYPYIYSQPAQNPAESGLHLMAILYYLVIECPVYFNSEYLINHLRYSIALWMHRGRLPF